MNQQLDLGESNGLGMVHTYQTQHQVAQGQPIVQLKSSSFTKLVKFEVNGDLDDDRTLDQTHKCRVRSMLARAARVCPMTRRWQQIRIGRTGGDQLQQHSGRIGRWSVFDQTLKTTCPVNIRETPEREFWTGCVRSRRIRRCSATTRNIYFYDDQLSSLKKPNSS